MTNFTNSQLHRLGRNAGDRLGGKYLQLPATLDYDGSHEIIDPGIKNGSSPTQPLQQLIGHWNVLNLSGGASAWASANMTISGTEIDLQNNHIKIDVGPSKHLQPQDWSAMLQFFRYRRLYTPSSVRATGLGDSSSTADMPKNTPDANTVPGLNVEQKRSLLAADPLNSGINNLWTIDATTGQMTVTRQDTTNTPVIAGRVMVELTGTGAPGPTTLP